MYKSTYMRLLASDDWHLTIDRRVYKKVFSFFLASHFIHSACLGAIAARPGVNGGDVNEWGFLTPHLVEIVTKITVGYYAQLL